MGWFGVKHHRTLRVAGKDSCDDEALRPGGQGVMVRDRVLLGLGYGWRVRVGLRH